MGQLIATTFKVVVLWVINKQLWCTLMLKLSLYLLLSWQVSIYHYMDFCPYHPAPPTLLTARVWAQPEQACWITRARSVLNKHPCTAIHKAACWIVLQNVTITIFLFKVFSQFRKKHLTEQWSCSSNQWGGGTSPDWSLLTDSLHGGLKSNHINLARVPSLANALASSYGMIRLAN